MGTKPSPGPIAALLILLALPASPSPDSMSVLTAEGGEYVYLDEMAAHLGLDHTYDMVLQKGKLYLGGRQAVYGVGLSAVLVNGALYRSDAAVRRRSGRVLIPLDAAKEIARAMSPGTVLERSGRRLLVRSRPGERAKPDGKVPVDRPGTRDMIRFIVIDAGHGGRDPGAVGRDGSREKEITLKVAKLVEKRIRASMPSLRVVVTRSDDRFVELSQRASIANRQLRKKENGIFLSIHVNSSLSPKISGTETFFLSQNPTNEEARNTAALENNVIILEEKTKKKGYDDVDYIEAMMITTQIQRESAALAAAVQGGLAKKRTGFGSRGVKKADFFVLRGALMPAALVEIGYISNAKEARFLQKEGHQKAIAEGITAGVKNFIGRYNSLIRVD